jgi:hypothetical protein
MSRAAAADEAPAADGALIITGFTTPLAGRFTCVAAHNTQRTPA